jgi:ubiquinone/menaquinone biosynthesis C-methylase UbiE
MEDLASSDLYRLDSRNSRFNVAPHYWADIYSAKGVLAEILRGRHTMALDWIDSLGLSSRARVLEIGCGAGFLTIELGRRGLQVHAVDSAQAMIELTERHVDESGLMCTVNLEKGDANSLDFEDESFDLVVAIGVVPWLTQPELAMREMTRVLRPGGYLLITANNRTRLNYLLDPMLNPLLEPSKMRLRAAVRRLRRQSSCATGATFHRCHAIDAMLMRAGLVKLRGMTLGFGPFMLFQRQFVPEPFSTALHHWLQRLADAGMPALRSTGAHYLVLSQK